MKCVHLGSYAKNYGQIEPRARAAVADIGYEQDKFHHAHFEFQNYLHEQSADIAQGVDASENSNEVRVLVTKA